MPKLETIDANPYLYTVRSQERSYPYPPTMAEVIEEKNFDTLRAGMAKIAKIRKAAMLGYTPRRSSDGSQYGYIPRRARDGAMYGLDAADSLDDSQVPYRAMPVYLRLVSSADQAMDYAAGGFHVSVGRGKVGGATESSDSYSLRLLGGQQYVDPTGGMNRADLTSAWSDAADAYKAAFNMAYIKSFVPGVDLSEVKAQLQTANALADKAYAAEGVAPPKDPGPQTTEVAPMSGMAQAAVTAFTQGAASAPSQATAAKKSNAGWYIGGIALASFIVGFLALRPNAKDEQPSVVMGLGRTRVRTAVRFGRDYYGKKYRSGGGMTRNESWKYRSYEPDHESLYNSDPDLDGTDCGCGA